MHTVLATGSPHNLGICHGRQASTQIHGSLNFYRDLFLKKCHMEWETVKQFASKYHDYLSQDYPDYVEEMRGVAEGAGLEYEDVLALNVRTEIAFGAFNDGCTAVSLMDSEGKKCFLGQNWDWNVEQSKNLILLKIQKENGLEIQMITEAGIIGKIGLNSNGVGCTLNALKAKGVSFSKLPCHLALRKVLESTSRIEAVEKLHNAGIASSCNIIIADETGSTGMEASTEDVVRYEMDERGVLVHTNHFLFEHPGVVEVSDWLVDTGFRLGRIRGLTDGFLKGKEKEGLRMEVLERFLEDEVEGDGASICRAAGKDGLATLFSVVMDLGERRGRVRVGRPSESSEVLVLSFQD